MSLGRDIQEVKELERHIFSDYLREFLADESNWNLKRPPSVSVADLLTVIKKYEEGGIK